MEFSETLSLFRDGDASAQHELFERWRCLLRLQARKQLGVEIDGPC